MSTEKVIDGVCGLEVIRKEATATIIGKGFEICTYNFVIGARSIFALRHKLLRCGITHIIMNNTGFYWKPVFEILSDHFTIILLNQGQIKNNRTEGVSMEKILLSELLRPVL